MRRNIMLASVIAAVVFAAGLGWFFGSQIKSPAEAAAEAEPPPASNITVEVIRQEMSADVITRGDIVYDEPVQVTLSGSFAEQPARLIVTQTVEAGAELTEGDMAVEVVGRPVFLLSGAIPMYRDLRPGASGDDVLQLEEALSRMGLLSTAPDEIWDESTGAAIAAWYDVSGYRPLGLSEEDETALQGARDRVRSAEAAIADSQTALAQAREGASASSILAAEGEIEAAQDALDLARLDATWAKEDAAAQVDAASAVLTAAQDALTVGETASPPLPADELAELQAAVIVATQDLATAQRQVDRIAPEQAALVAQAENRVSVAKASLQELRRGPDTSALSRQIGLAREEADAARTALSELETSLGTWLPAGEIVFIERLPVRVDRVSVERGSEISGSFVTVTGSEVTLRAAVSEADIDLLVPGMAVLIENPADDSTTIAGTITAVADQPGTNGVAQDRFFIEIEPSEIPDEIIGENVRVTIPVSSTDGEVLAVPAAALYATADGSTRVEIEEPDGTVITIRVETGLAAGGLVEITPQDGSIEEGDLVVVGRADGSRPGDSTEESQPNDDA